jgi:hypothetical protein
MLAALIIAIATPYRLHPDEYVHLGAFQYFEGKFFPPDIGADGIVYSAYGQSRVFSRELVYILYGNLAHVIHLAIGGEPTYLTYRLFNVLLLLITLVIIFFCNVKFPLIRLFGFALVCIPQLMYTYAYANSDAWSVSVSIFTFIFAIYLTEKLIVEWSFKDYIYFGSLTGLTLVAKDNFILSLILPYSLLAFKAYQELWQQKQKFDQRWPIKIVAGTIALLIVAAPLRIVYTLSQGDYRAAIDRTREERAIPGYKPSNPTFPGLHLKSKGYSYDHLLIRRKWHRATARSFWGYYGHMRFITKPKRIYSWVLYGTIAAIILTGFTLWRSKIARQDPLLVVGIPVAVATLALNIYASLRHSLYFDYQAQGRYLYPSLMSVCLLVMGTAPLDSFRIKTIRSFIWLGIYIMGLYSLFFVGIAKMVSHTGR